MLSRFNANEFCKQLSDVLNGPKRDVSRSYRRLLERLAPGGAITLVFGDEETLLTRTRYDQLRQYVQERVEHWKEMDILPASAHATEPELKRSTTQVLLHVTLLDRSPEETSLCDWREAAWILRGLAQQLIDMPDWLTQIEHFATLLSKRRARARVAAAIAAR